MAAVEQHRRLAVGRRQLEPTGGGLVGGFHLRDNASERSIAQAIFGKRQYIGILPALGIEDFVGAKANLLKARRIKVETRHGPEDGEPRLHAKACRDPGGEEGRACIVVEARRGGSDFMQSRAVEAMIGQTLVQLDQSEGQGWPARGPDVRQVCTKRGKLVDPVLVEGRGASGHGNNDSICSLYVPLSLPARQGA